VNRIMVRYRVRPECAETNEQLVRAVFRELATDCPEGFSYQSMVLSDGMTFVHVVDGDDDVLPTMPAFQRFVADVGARCEDPPVQTTVRIVGSYEGRTS
jgi:hypothetical protein